MVTEFVLLSCNCMQHFSPSCAACTRKEQASFGKFDKLKAYSEALQASVVEASG